jgi:hypothetical protein
MIDKKPNGHTLCSDAEEEDAAPKSPTTIQNGKGDARTDAGYQD